MFTGCGIRPLQSFTSLRKLRRCISSKARNLSYALQNTAKEASDKNKSDQTNEAQKRKELLQVISSIKSLKENEKPVDGKQTNASMSEYWHRRNEMPIPVRQESDIESNFAPKILFDENPIPQILWHDTLNRDQEYWQNKRQQQLKLEQSFVDEALLEYKKFATGVRNREMAATLPSLKHIMQRWIPPLSTVIQNQQHKILLGDFVNGCMDSSQALSVLEPDELAVLTIHTILGSLLRTDRDNESRQHTSLLEVASRVGRAVQGQVNLLKLKQRVESENKRRKMLNKFLTVMKEEGKELIPSDRLQSLDPWEKNLIKRSVRMENKIRLMKNQWTKRGITYRNVASSQWMLGKEQANWTDSTIARVGAVLVDLFRQTALVKIDKRSGKIMGKDASIVRTTVPVLKHEIIWTKRGGGGGTKSEVKSPRKMGVLSIHPSIIETVETAASNSFFAKSYPMVYPPLEWRSLNRGAYLTLYSRVLRSYEQMDPVKIFKQSDKNGQLNQIYDALTILGRTPWKMNKEVLEVLEKVWEQGGGRLELPSRIDVPVPAPAKRRFRLGSSSGALHLTFDDETELETSHRRSETYRIRKKNSELHSLRCDVELKLSVARKFLNEERIYFPHNIDFRGRAYPIPPHLNHLGNDMCRGLLLFAEGRPLGSRGLNWLYIQIANLYGSGQDKKSLEDRLQFGRKNLDRILDSANRPLDGAQWWMDADSPWQFLATCKEIRNALNCDTPEEYISHMHVHQDGSCNGLQHYAALGRDATGAAAVNLRRCDAPNDVYSEIATIVRGIVQEDAAKGHRWAQILDGHVDRKLVKQTVMTSVYGVTFIGAREQIANRLRERGWDDNHELYQVSFYAARVTMTGLHQMFKTAKDVMHWLSNCAKEIARNNETVIWRTPLGLPVAQPYRTCEVKSVKTVLQHVNLASTHSNLPVMKRRQRTAFPPNYIHSLDSTHMMMTALGCYQRGVTFAGVHDSFWTHASSVDEMNVVLREKFYELHSRPLLQELIDQFHEVYHDKDASFPEVPSLGDFNLKEIHDAKYFFN
eukprot:g619.t1